MGTQCNLTRKPTGIPSSVERRSMSCRQQAQGRASGKSKQANRNTECSTTTSARSTLRVATERVKRRGTTTILSLQALSTLRNNCILICTNGGQCNREREMGRRESYRCSSALSSSNYVTSVSTDHQDMHLKSRAQDASQSEEKGTGKGLYGVRFVGVGSAVPDKVITNSDLERSVDTSDEWITTRTGIRARRVLPSEEESSSSSPVSVTDLAVLASDRAMKMAGITALEIDMIVLATSTPDDCFGGACLLQKEIGARNAFAFDITAACSGFVVAITTASNFMAVGSAKNVLVVGADAMSRIVDWQDRGTCILFGDGAGAVIMRRSDIAHGNNPVSNENGKRSNGNSHSIRNSSMLGYALHSDGSGNKHLTASYNPFREGEEHGLPSPAPSSFNNIAMSGSEVFKFAVRSVPAVVSEALQESGIDDINSVDWFVLHQANQRILDSASSRLGIDSSKVISNLSNYGNTSAASIPLALDEAVREGKIRCGDRVAVAGFGAGLTWGCAIIIWG